MELNTTSIDEIKKALAGEIVNLPPFVQGTEFNARLRRVSIAELVHAGKIPNPLLEKVCMLFNDNITEDNTTQNQADIDELNKFIDAVVLESLLEPSVADLNDAGISLTYEQKNAIFKYIQQGALALGNFRIGQGYIKADTNVKNLSSQAQPDITNN